MTLIIVLCIIFCLLFVLHYLHNDHSTISINSRPVYCCTDYMNKHDINYLLGYFTPKDPYKRIAVGYKPVIPKGATRTYDLQLGGNSEAIKNMVLKLLQPFVNLKFVFASQGQNLCKVTEIAGSTSWGGHTSIQLGKGANYTNNPSVTIHEFCHSLQMQHELQNPNRDIQFVESAVFAYYKQIAGWTEAQTRQYVLNKFPASSVIATEFDKTSIMLYSVPGNLVQGGVGIIQGRELSTLDKRWLSDNYGPPPTVLRNLLYSLQSFEDGKFEEEDDD